MYSKQSNLGQQTRAIQRPGSKLKATDQRDTISFAGKRKPFYSQEALKKYLGLSLYATEDEFLEARGQLLQVILKITPDTLSEAELAKVKRFPKSLLTTIAEIDPHSSRDDMEKAFEKYLQRWYPRKSEAEINMACAVIMAYPKPHPFEYPGQILGESFSSGAAQ